MNRMMTTLALTVISTTTAFAGGHTPEVKFQDAIVSCSGTNGELLFRVFKDQYNGEILSLSDAQIATTIKLTNAQVIAAAKKLDLINSMRLYNLPKNKDHLALHLEAGSTNVSNLQGGTDELQYTNKLTLINSLSSIVKSTAPEIKNFLNVNVEQKSETKYKITFTKIQAGQRTCVTQVELPNPYFIEGSNSNPTFMGCAEWSDVAAQMVAAKFSTELNIDQCVLK